MIDATHVDEAERAPEAGGADQPALPVLVEGLLFVTDGPVAVGDLARALEVPRPKVERALGELTTLYEGRGLRLQRTNGHIQLVSAPEAGVVIQRYLGLEASTHLSRAALEALSIVAYRQPVTRPEVDAVRGVHSEGVLRTLLARGMVEPVGRRETVGHPIEYGTTFLFLEYFGLGGLDDLPPMETFDAMAGAVNGAVGGNPGGDVASAPPADD